MTILEKLEAAMDLIHPTGFAISADEAEEAWNLLEAVVEDLTKASAPVEPKEEI